MSNRDVAAVLAEIAVLSELNGENPFRCRAFAAAARTLEGSDIDLVALAREGRLTSLPGIGAAIAETMRELVETGRSRLHEELQSATPIGLYDLLRVPGLGAKRIHTVHERLGVDSLDGLEAAALDGRLASLPGFGAKTAQKVLAGIAFVREGLRRRRFPEARQAADRLLASLRARPEVVRAEAAGDLRRLLEVVDGIELVAATEQPEELVRAFGALNGVELLREAEGFALARLADGITARLRCVPPAGWGWALVRGTGSPAHLEALAEHGGTRGVTLDEGRILRDGEPASAEEEADVYDALGLPFIPPEMREGLDEVELAKAGALPRLITLDELRGTFHCHTVFSDGRATVAEMAEGAAARGWRYLGLADHSQTAAYAGGLSPPRIVEQHAAIDAWNRARVTGDGEGEGVRIFKGIESDILADGSLDYPDEILASFDYVVGSVHSGMRMSEAEMTERMLRAVRNPYLTVLGHPTGRRLLTRNAYPLDVERVLDAAAEHGVVVEINANPHRLDLDWRYLRYAAERGILLAINPDAHSVAGLDDVLFGVNMARKGGLEARQVLNTWTLTEVEEFFARRKARIEGGA